MIWVVPAGLLRVDYAAQLPYDGSEPQAFGHREISTLRLEALDPLDRTEPLVVEVLYVDDNDAGLPQAAESSGMRRFRCARSIGDRHHPVAALEQPQGGVGHTNISLQSCQNGRFAVVWATAARMVGSSASPKIILLKMGVSGSSARVLARRRPSVGGLRL